MHLKIARLSVASFFDMSNGNSFFNLLWKWHTLVLFFQTPVRKCLIYEKEDMYQQEHLGAHFSRGQLTTLIFYNLLSIF